MKNGLVMIFLLMVSTSCYLQSMAEINLPKDVAHSADLVYRTVDGHSLELDLLWRPDAESAVPLLIYIHGGA